MGKICVAFAGALALALAGCASVPPNKASPSDEKELDAAFDQQIPRAQRLEAEADRLLASGNEAGAIRAYVQALGLAGINSVAGLNTWGSQAPGAVAVNDGWQVFGITDDTPAFRAGVRSGDIVVRINGTSVAGLSRARLRLLLEDDPLNPIAVSLRRGAGPESTATIEAAIDSYGSTSERRPVANRIHSKLVDIYSASARRPPISSRARSAALRAQNLAKKASSGEDIKYVSDVYRAVTYLAPWWSALYINYALFQEAADDPLGATESLRNYLKLSPNGSDASDVRAKIATLAPKAERQRELARWEGWWSTLENGRPTDKGIPIERNGNTITSKWAARPEPWMVATIVDGRTAKGIVRYSRNTTTDSGMRQQMIDKCFNGRMDVAVTATLSDGGRRLDLSYDSNAVVEYPSCSIVRMQRMPPNVYVK